MLGQPRLPPASRKTGILRPAFHQPGASPCAPFAAFCLLCSRLPAPAGLRPGRALPGRLPHPEHQDRRRHHLCPRRRQGPGGGAAARLRRHRRHVGAGRQGALQGPHRHRARPARHGPVVATEVRLRQENARPGHRQGDGRAQDRQSRSGHPRHRQHGRLCARRAISGAHHQMGDHRRAAARHRPVGRDPQEPAALAFQFPRPRCRPPGERPRAHLSRPLLQRTVGQSESDRRSDAPALRPALCAPRQHALCVRAVRDLQHQGPRRQQGIPGQGQAADADPGARRRSLLRRDAGRGHARGRQQCRRRHHQEFRPLDHGRTAGADGETDQGVSGQEVQLAPRSGQRRLTPGSDNSGFRA